MCARKKAVAEEKFQENIIERPLSKAIHDYMLPYAEYIILDRSLPRVEDGLKPVQRRILYTMHELNMKPDGPYKKSARVVGDCLGKYHPHGDTSVYDAMVKMAQDFNMRNTLVKGHGNFGSIDGDGAAAMRYTEVKLDYLACELLRDLEKDTVKWVKNFDDSLLEPDLLPGRFPNLLVNGCIGISIGLATNIPSHNLTEVIDGVIALIDNPKMPLSELLKIIKGPDFCTGGFIVPVDGFESMYETGRGKFVMRARAEIENGENGKQSIVITEIPYGVNKSKLQQRILALREAAAGAKKESKDDKNSILLGIQEIVDESDRNGIRVVIRLKKGEDAVKILDLLYKKTDLQCNFSANMVAIADGRPQQMGLIPIIKYYIEYQREIILKRSQFDLNNAKKREHILDGYAMILPEIDKVVELIKSSNSRSEAKDKLRTAFPLSEKQADAILDLKLVNLTKMEVTKIQKELAELKAKIAVLEKIVSSRTEQLKVVRQELTEIRNAYPSRRCSVIVKSLEDIDYNPFKKIDSDEAKKGYVVLDACGGIKFMNTRQYILADKSSPIVASDVSKFVIHSEGQKQILVIGSQGNCYRLNPNNMRESAWKDKGEPLEHLFDDVPTGEKAVSVLKFNEEDLTKEIYFFTKQGMVKRSLASEYVVNKDVFQGIILKEGDEVVNVEFKREEANIVFVSDDGQCLNSETADYPLQGRKAGGVIGMVLNEGSQVKLACQIDTEFDEIIGEILLISKGFAKRVIASTVEPLKRARKGVKVMTVTGKLLYAGAVSEPCNVALIDKDGAVRKISSEDVLIDRNRAGKGKSLVVSANCVDAVRIDEEI